jgi:hypothetical protein
VIDIRINAKVKCDCPALIGYCESFLIGDIKVELNNIKRSVKEIIESDSFYKSVSLVVIGIVVGLWLSNVEMLKSVEFWRVMIPALVAIGAWFWNERSKLVWEQYKRKEENYKELLRSLKGFYLATHDQELIKQFLFQRDMLWLYAPDTVIHIAQTFLEKQSTPDTQDGDKMNATGTLIVAIRKDLLENKPVKKTGLSPSDYKNYTLRRPEQQNNQGI